ncbi:MAG: WYL domain-containing protein, partial [Solobacterium sp.]|nr:WYL domain-containing protein [Solobacterium sp.]
ISLKPTKKSSSIISYIQNELTKNISLSGYFRNLFDSYVSMPQDEREKIIFRETYEIIQKAIQQKKKLSIATYRKPDYFHHLSPYTLSSSKEELFNYLLGAKENRICSFRVSRIRTIVIEEEKSFITKEQLVLLKKMEQYGPQFMISREEEIVVKLGQRGKELYQALYLHRPAVDHIEGDLYYFYCSEEQIRQYFSRFGKYAEIIKPEYLRNELKQFYKEAYEIYENGRK